MGQSYETSGHTAMADLAAKQPHELLIQLGGALTVLLIVVMTAIQWSQGIAAIRLTEVTTLLVIDVILGGALWVSSAVVRKNLMNGAIVAGVVSAILIVYGGQPGTIGGLVGILGAILAAASPYLPWSHKK
jgi:hypothetical protein